ncbi:MAG: Asp-tRNA(Asn)/Glu-tRNA(Gln) amidotransferase subunit GatA [Vulcanimicrobiota bacterium]
MDLIQKPVHELSSLLTEKKISSVELTRAFLDRINKTENKIKAFLRVFNDEAVEMAKRADIRRESGEEVTPLLGIPLALKDNLCVKGFPTTCGSKMLEDFIPPYNATVVEQLDFDGLIILGKTNMDEFAMGSSTENSAFFATTNPWGPGRVPGGSSGGSASAVAALQAPLALGSDTGGSIRQPAAFCGVTGMKPTYGAVSRYGLIAFASSLDQIGPIARNVKDLALLLDVIVGKDPRDATSVVLEKSGYFKSLEKMASLKGVRVGWPVDFYEKGLDGQIKAQMERNRVVFEDLGAEFVEISLPIMDYALASYYIIAPSEASSNLARYDGVRYGYRNAGHAGIIDMSRKTRREGFGSEVLRRIMIGTYALSSGYYDAYYLKAQKVRTLIKNSFNEAFKKCHTIMTPATPTLPFKLEEKKEDPLAMYLSDIYTVPVNLAGLPALVLPCGFIDGLPVGLQLIGRAFDEITLLQQGNLFQKNSGFHRKTPLV